MADYEHARVEMLHAMQLHVAAFEVSRIAHIPRPGLTNEQNAQRSSILQIAAKVLEADVDRQFDIALEAWAEYRQRHPKEE